MTDDLAKTLDQSGAYGETVMSWLSKLHEAQAETAGRKTDSWRLPLERVRGKIDYDGIERVTTQMLLDVLVNAAGERAPIGVWRSSWLSSAGPQYECAT